MSGSRYVKLKDIEETSTLECHEKALISSSSIISSPHTKYISSPLILPLMQTQAFGVGKFEYTESSCRTYDLGHNGSRDTCTPGDRPAKTQDTFQESMGQ